MSAPNLLLFRMAEFLRQRTAAIVGDSETLLNAESDECSKNPKGFPWPEQIEQLLQETADRLLARAAEAEGAAAPKKEGPASSSIQCVLLEGWLVRNCFLRALNRFQNEQTGQNDFTALDMSDARRTAMREFDGLMAGELSQWISEQGFGSPVPRANAEELREIHGGVNAVLGLLRLATEKIPPGARIHVTAATEQLARLSQQVQHAGGFAPPPPSPKPPAAPEPGGAPTILPPVREPLRLSPLDVPSFVRNVAESFRSAAEQKGLKFECRCGPAPQVVRTDAAKLHRAVSLLLDHSVNYTETGGITFTAGLNTASAWSLGVRDTGPGVPPEVLSRVLLGLDHARQEEHEGSVFGIAVARDLADLLGGTLEAESKAGVGTHFRLILPVN